MSALSVLDWYRSMAFRIRQAHITPESRISIRLKLSRNYFSTPIDETLKS